MNDSLLRKVAESPQRWLIVTAVTLGISLVTLLPQVDHYLTVRSERSVLEAQIARASESAELLPQYERRVAGQEAELDRLRDRLVDEKRVAELRDWLVEAAREAGCRVRRVDIGMPTQRRWMTEDNHLNDESQQAAGRQTPFELQKRRVSFSILGDSEEVRAMLEAIDSDGRLIHAHSVDLRPADRRKQIQLDLTLWYYALVKPEGVA